MAGPRTSGHRVHLGIVAHLLASTSGARRRFAASFRFSFGQGLLRLAGTAYQQGDTGTGKELLAEAIHKLWMKTQDKPEAPFVVAQVAGLPPDLAIDELFGHVKGAYTNAVKDREGRIQNADGGTLLIDEVGDLPPEAQVRLLRFLQTRKIARTGEDTEKSVRVRVLAATWRDLTQMIAQGTFRKDLYHRLCYGTSLKLPPLTKREGLFEEVVPEILTRRGHRTRPLLARNAREALKAHDWPGNLRELVGVLEEASSLAQDSTIRLEHLPAHLQRRYLQLPLLERAPGYLAEELDSQELTEEHARWRGGRLEQQLAAYMPEENAVIAQVAQILATLPGSLPEHEEAVHAVSKWSEAERLVRRHEELAQYWSTLIEIELPEFVVRVLQEKEAESRKRASEHRQQMGDYERLADRRLEQHPWIRLMTEVRSLPLFSEAEPGGMAKVIQVVFGFLQKFDPAGAMQILDEVRRGVFLQRFRSKTIPGEKPDGEQQPDTGAPNTNQLAEPKKVPAKDRPPGFWQQLATTHKSQAEAIKVTGYDPKTINSYLEKHGVPNPWARSSSE